MLVSGTCRPLETGTVSMRIMQDSVTVNQTAPRIQRSELSEFLIRRTYLELRRGAIRSEAMERDRNACMTAKKFRVGVKTTSTVRYKISHLKTVPAKQVCLFRCHSHLGTDSRGRDLRS